MNESFYSNQEEKINNKRIKYFALSSFQTFFSFSSLRSFTLKRLQTLNSNKSKMICGIRTRLWLIQLQLTIEYIKYCMRGSISFGLIRHDCIRQQLLCFIYAQSHTHCSPLCSLHVQLFTDSMKKKCFLCFLSSRHPFHFQC